MILYDENLKKFKKANHILNLVKDGVENIVYTDDLDWYINFCENWDNAEIISFEEVNLNVEQELRLSEIRELEHEYISDCKTYVESGVIGETKSVILKNLKLQHEISKIKNDNANMWYEIMTGGMS